MRKGSHTNPLTRGPCFEALLMDGGWLTPEGLALIVGIAPKSARNSLSRYQKRGLVESRERDINKTPNPREYRVTSAALKEYEC